MPTNTVLDVLVPPFTARAMAVYTEYRTTHPGNTRPVRIAAVEIAQGHRSAWVIAAHVRAAIAGKTGRDVGKFDLNDYVEPSDLGQRAKGKQ
jgi:hypothetical protein